MELPTPVKDKPKKAYPKNVVRGKGARMLLMEMEEKTKKTRNTGGKSMQKLLSEKEKDEKLESSKKEKRKAVTAISLVPNKKPKLHLSSENSSKGNLK